MKEIIRIIVIAALLAGGVACQEKGPVEKAGERVDEVVDNVREGQPPLHRKGILEKTGESIDDAVTDLRESMATPKSR